MIMEDKILEYLEGSLGESERAELLETLSVSPEKRALLEEHLRLKDLFALGRKPFSVPVETERELARRIPIIGRYGDNLAPTRWAFSGVRRFIGSRPIGVAAAAMLLLAGLGWYTMQQSNYVTKSPSITIRDRNSTNWTNTTGAPHNIALQYSSASTNFPTALGASSNVRYGLRNVRTSSGSTAHSLALLPSTSTPRIAEHMADETSALTPIADLRESSSNIPIGHSAHTLEEIQFGEPGKLSPLTIGASLILDESYLPTFSTGPQHTLQTLLEDVTMDYDLTPNFSVGIELGEGASSSLTNISQLTNSMQLTNPSADYTRVVNNGVVSGATIYDALLALHFTLFPEGEYQVRLGADGGTAFGAGPMAEATAGISRVLAPNLLLDVTAIASRVWTKGSSPISNSSAEGVIGIVGTQVPPQSMYTTAFGVRAGLRIRL